MKNKYAEIAIVGGGIVGLAHAYEAAKRGMKVVIFERHQHAMGASIRNFGLIWPIGQSIEVLERALVSRQVWIELAQAADFWIHQNGSLHLAYHIDELGVLQEFAELYSRTAYDCEVYSSDRTQTLSPLIKSEGLLGALHSKTECTVNPREAIAKIHTYLSEQMGVVINYGHNVTEVNMPYIMDSRGEKWRVEKTIICNGADFETLYPKYFTSSEMTKCKLQMMKGEGGNSFLGPTLCAGLTLRHYDAFKKCPSLLSVSERYNETNPEFSKYGIHVLLAQNHALEFIIGDSHEYGFNPEPFDSEIINQYILNYLQTFTTIPDLQITERWHGVYSKVHGNTEIVFEVEKDVIVVNALSGAGMTLSFGLAREVLDKHVSDFGYHKVDH